MSSLGVVKIEPHSEPWDFLQALAQSHAAFLTGVLRAEPYIYRGQASYEWPLIPPAFRRDARLYTGEGWVKGPQKTNREQIDAEFQTLRKFFEIGDYAGLRMPDDGQALRSALLSVGASLEDDDETVWPPRSLLSLLALAQHSGIPTRLLDWTSDPYVAAYFAAHSSMCGHGLGTDIAVYQLPIDVLEEEEQSWAGSNKHGVSLRLATAPAADNVNLHAQKGRFTYYECPSTSCPETRTFVIEGYPHDEKLRCISVEQVLHGIYERNSQNIINGFTLPADRCKDLLRHLRRLGYDTARLFPSFEGVVKFMKESDQYGL